ncbi:MAG TPA: hypothetical protein VMD74_04630, partial [Candidatus Methylomirabilis sp.]|nr:hypothetical protein [Candidatus Methylomirabilis sp.]
MLNFRNKLRIVWITALIIAVFWLVWLAVVPGGKITYITDFKSFNDFIGKLTPAERMIGNKIIGDPAYFSLRVPRRFTSAKVTLKYQVDDSVPIIEAGVLQDQRTWQYNLQPIYNAKINELLGKWNVLRDGNTILLQRQKNFSSIADFLKNPPPAEKIALYDYDLKNKFVLPGYQPTNNLTTLCRPLQGSFQFYTYLKNENLSFDFFIEDLNQNSGADPVDAQIYYQDQEISAENLVDDGFADDSGKNITWRHLRLDLANLPEGVYKIALSADNDIVTRSITTWQSKIAFINKVNLAAAPEVSCGRNLITNSHQIQAQTVHADKLQTIKIVPSPFQGEGQDEVKNNNLTPTLSLVRRGGQAASTTLAITEPFTQFSTTSTLPALSNLILQNDGVAISGDGLFSFGVDQFFNPTIRKIDANFSADKEGIDYVLANYVAPAHDGHWMISTAEFDLQNA